MSVSVGRSVGCGGVKIVGVLLWGTCESGGGEGCGGSGEAVGGSGAGDREDGLLQSPWQLRVTQLSNKNIIVSHN